MKNLATVIGLIVIGIVAVIGLSSIGAYPFKWCWNYVVPRIFGLPKIGAWEAFCLLWVGTSLFKSTNTSSK